jgi:uncharacterized protein HemY
MRRILRQVQELNLDEIDTISEELEKEGVSADEQLFQQYYRQGLNALEEQEWPRAVQLFKLALDMRPDSSEVLQRLRKAQEGQASPQGSSGRGFTPGL